MFLLVIKVIDLEKIDYEDFMIEYLEVYKRVFIFLKYLFLKVEVYFFLLCIM